MAAALENLVFPCRLGIMKSLKPATKTRSIIVTGKHELEMIQT